MSLMDPSTEVGLFAPPACIAIVFLVGWNISKASAGRVSPGKARALAIYCLALLVAGYVIVWWREITFVWFRAPVLTLFSSLGIASAIVFLIVAIARRPDAEPASEHWLKPEVKGSAPVSVPRRVFSWIIIVWGIAGFVGGIWAIVRNELSR